jgi:hypothetical protein
MSSVFLWNGVNGEVDFVLIRLLGPFLCDVGSSHVNCFVFFGLSELFNCFLLHEEDLFGNMHISTALKLHWFSRDLSCLPIDLWIEVIKEGVPQDDAVFS